MAVDAAAPPSLDGVLSPASLAHIRALDAGWARLVRGERPPSPLHHERAAALPAADREVEVLIAGGGLGLLFAWALLAQAEPGRAPRLLLLDPRPIGQTHREWNISRPELEVLVQQGLFSWEELTGVIARSYQRGLLQFHDPAGAPTVVELPGVLDVALDSDALLHLARVKVEAAGGTLLQARLVRAWLSKEGAARSVVEVETAAGSEHVGTRLLVNAMGALSPLTLALAGAEAPFDAVCPTVGTVAQGFAEGEVAPEVGEILVTVAGAGRDGRQLIWEGFPGHGETLTTYLFYYDQIEGRAERPHSLERLYEEYAALLPTYKAPGPDLKHLKAVYGFIPARHRLDGSPSERARTARGLLSIGDAAARQNPLTFTGFGSFVRQVGPLARATLDCLRDGDLEADHLATLGHAPPSLAAMWVMARFLAPGRGPDSVNGIFRDFSRALNEVGSEAAPAFFLDRATRREYVEIMLRTARHRPQVVAEAFRVLGGRGVARWLSDLARWQEAPAAPDAALPLPTP